METKDIVALIFGIIAIFFLYLMRYNEWEIPVFIIIFLIVIYVDYRNKKKKEVK